jgi:hypothetical protein
MCVIGLMRAGELAAITSGAGEPDARRPWRQWEFCNRSAKPANVPSAIAPNEPDSSKRWEVRRTMGPGAKAEPEGGKE